MRYDGKPLCDASQPGMEHLAHLRESYFHDQAGQLRICPSQTARDHLTAWIARNTPAELAPASADFPGTVPGQEQEGQT